MPSIQLIKNYLKPLLELIDQLDKETSFAFLGVCFLFSLALSGLLGLLYMVMGVVGGFVFCRRCL